MKKCGWCSRKYEDDGILKCVCGWYFLSQDEIELASINHALAELYGDKTPCNDISRWQRTPTGPQHDFRKMATKSRGCWIKRTQANFEDRDGDSNAAGALGIIARGYYVYLDWSMPFVAQIDYFFSQFLNLADVGELPVVLDYEEWTNAPQPGTARAQLRAAIERTEYHLNRLGYKFARKILLYTSPGYWAYFGSSDRWWADHCDLYIAHYGVSTPAIPPPWTFHVVHQWGFGNGPDHGVQSLEIDMDDFNGGETAFNAYALPLPGSTPPPEPPPSEVVMRSKCIQPWQYFRSDHYATNATLIPGPGMNGYLVVLRDEIVETNEPPWLGPRAGGDVWIHVKNSHNEFGWIATNYAGTIYQVTVT
jgi:GH25 family lysozyme M1 (1,4-beta-N-acetylmuramidase)